MTIFLYLVSLRDSIAQAFAIALCALALSLSVALTAAAAEPTSAASAPASGARPSATAGTVFEGIAATPIDIGEPSSPRASLAHYFEAVREGRWEGATRHLVLDAKQRLRGADLARRLKAVIDDTGWIDLEAVSDSAQGKLDDGLPATLEEIARLTLDGRPEPLRMVRRTDEQGAHWAFSAATVARVDAWYDRLPDRRLRDLLVASGLDVMLLPGPLELLWWQWIALTLLLVLAWPLGSLFARATRFVLKRLLQRSSATGGDAWAGTLGEPLTLAWSLAVVYAGSTHLLLLAPAYRLIHGLTTAGIVLAAFWALWRGAAVGARQLVEHPWARDNASARTLISVGGNFARGAILFAGVLAILSALGFPIGTLLAGLGIGGLALAFGAQKTLENLFGSIAIAVDQPFRVGDAVSVDGVVGVVENIGLRSTWLRTADRTMVSIPNGKLADQRAESFATRDRFRLTATIGLTYGTTREQVVQVIDGAQRVLSEHPHAAPDAVDVRFVALGASSLDIEVVAWFAVPTPAEFARCRQEALLAIMKVVEDAGAEFAFPTQTVHLVGASAA